MRQVRNWICLSVLMLAAFAASPGYSATLRLVIVADTNDGSIGEGVRANELNFRNYLTWVSQGLQIPLKESAVIDGTSFAKENAGCKKIRDALTGLTVDPDDTVFFYYSGHGYRKPGSPSKFPYFYCSDGGDTDFGLNDVDINLKTKSARLVIGIADTCNVVLGQRPPQAAAATGASIDQLAALRQLFLLSRGVVLMSGSKPGEFSWYRASGGLFSGQLFRALDNVIATKGLTSTWKIVTDKASRPLSVTDLDGTLVATQHPIVKLVGPNLGLSVAAAGN